jgi:hypothetical protein
MSMRILPSGFVPPCLPTKVPQPPSGCAWVHEIKHDGFREIARKGDWVRLYSRPGNDPTHRFPLIVERCTPCPKNGGVLKERFVTAVAPAEAEAWHAARTVDTEAPPPLLGFL